MEIGGYPPFRGPSAPTVAEWPNDRLSGQPLGGHLGEASAAELGGWIRARENHLQLQDIVIELAGVGDPDFSLADLANHGKRDVIAGDLPLLDRRLSRLAGELFSILLELKENLGGSMIAAVLSFPLSADVSGVGQ
jgi:hypothetical protein